MKNRRRMYNPCASQYSKSVSKENGWSRYNDEVEKDYTHASEKDLELIRKLWRKDMEDLEK
jgi:hypothetical protein